MIRIKKQKKQNILIDQNIDRFRILIGRERQRQRERGGGGGERERSSHRTLKQTIVLKAANVTCAANNTELMKSAATGQREAVLLCDLN